LCLLFFIEDGSLARRDRDGAYHGAVGKTGKNFRFLARATNITAPRPPDVHRPTLCQPEKTMVK